MTRPSDVCFIPLNDVSLIPVNAMAWGPISRTNSILQLFGYLGTTHWRWIHNLGSLGGSGIIISHSLFPAYSFTSSRLFRLKVELDMDLS